MTILTWAARSPLILRRRISAVSKDGGARVRQSSFEARDARTSG